MGTLGPGVVLSAGSEAAYRSVAAGVGEERTLRADLSSQQRTRRRPSTRRERRSLLYIGHVTDLQLADVCSPGRFEFFEELRGLAGSGAFVPAQRPQEALCPHAIDAMVRRLASLGPSEDSGSALDLVISSGDNIDNAQWNELSWYLSLLGGGQVYLGSGRGYAGVQQQDWPDWPGELFWRPDGGADRWKSLYGYPTMPGLLEEAVSPFAVGGV
ncbi:MAG: hypothetical protein ACRDZ5_09975, partial [Acidimicrobiales bacterium]